MRRAIAIGLLVCPLLHLHAQYPYTRTFDLRSGQSRPHITAIVQDPEGLIWVASDLGLMRSDGERTDPVWNGDRNSITALASNAHGVYAALSSGHVLHCEGYHCDTVAFDTLLRTHPVRAMWALDNGTIWAGTYGAGVLVFIGDSTEHFGSASGLPDQHVNALCPTRAGRMAVATDQGIVIMDEQHGVLRRIGEEQGAPDNLVLALAPGDGGLIIAGTDRSGVFSFEPNDDNARVVVLDSAWSHGPVSALVSGDGLVWAGTAEHGTVVCDIRHGLATYLPRGPFEGESLRTLCLLRALDGAVWWCDGSERVRRADPDILYVPQHEGHDLRHITAICADHDDRIWFATAAGIFHHQSNFADELELSEVGIHVDTNHTVVSLHATGDGAVWAGTFGQGVYRIGPDGEVRQFTEKDGLCNNNVISIRSRSTASGGVEVWFATLGGICEYIQPSVMENVGTFRTIPSPGSGFLYDILTMADGSVLAATDGSGIIRVSPDGTAQVLKPPGQRSVSFYSLCVDMHGTAWACGPMIGLCRVDGDTLHTFATQPGPFDPSVYAITAYADHVLALGKTGLVAFDAANGTMLDMGNATGLADVEAELNTVCTDASGAIWLACDRGLVRLRPRSAALTGVVPTVITGMNWGEEQIPLDSALHLRYDQNFLTFRFAGLHYAAPEDVRFEYRLIGFDPRVRTTRDREVNWPRLPWGDFRFEMRAAIGKEPAAGPWTTFSFSIAAPWWRTAWFIAACVVVFAALFYAFVRGREERFRYRDRMEKEKARFQLDALRSQVNPHFLFNSFNTLIALIEEDTQKAVQHVEHLSDFFREMLQVRDKDLIPLMEELQLVDTYFYLEQRRFGRRIALHNSVDIAAGVMLVPPLALQLLVENALKHNAATLEDPLIITISADQRSLMVSNPLRPRSEPARSTGFGIESIRKRYATFSDRPVEVINDGATFTVRIPLIDREP